MPAYICLKPSLMPNWSHATRMGNPIFWHYGRLTQTCACGASTCRRVPARIFGNSRFLIDGLRELLIATDDDRLRFSEEFPDPVKLLEVAEKMGLEGVISKRRTSPYLSGTQCGWIKVKTAAWRETNKDRGELFQRHKHAADS
jgi:hypothetical protein